MILPVAESNANDEFTGSAAAWAKRFLDDLSVVRSANTVRAYGADVQRWIAFCRSAGVDPLLARPRTAVDFIKAESQRITRKGGAVGARTLARRLSAVRQWYEYLALEPELTGIRRNPIPGGSAMRTATGVVLKKAALLRYDRALPKVLAAEDVDLFITHSTATRHRDRAIVWLLKDGGMRIHEVLDLRVSDINWSKRTLIVRSSKSRSERLVPVSADAITALSDYVRLERPRSLPHDYVFVNLGRRSFGQPFQYRSWVAICDQARQAAATPTVHAHAFRHTFATNMAEGGMPLDVLQRILGHRNLETVMVYNRVRDGRLYREYQEAMAIQTAAKRIHQGLV
jgi:integrase/recombinase XerC